MDNSERILKISDLSKSYGDLKALDEVNLYIPKGKVAGLVGPNGAGKTTLIKCINGFLNHSGKINVMNFSEAKLNKSEIGYLAEDEGYYSDWTGREYLEYFSELYHIENKEKVVKEKLKLVGLHDRKDDLIKEYSNGMKKRLGIARTLLHDPNLIILDEPLSGLDPLIKSELTQLIASIAEGNRSVLISSHQLKDIESICDWVIFIKEGEVRDFGDPQSISKSRDSLKTLVFDIAKEDVEIISNIDSIESVTEYNLKEDILVVKGRDKEEFEEDVFRWLLKNEVDFSLKQGSLDDLYKEVFEG